MRTFVCLSLLCLSAFSDEVWPRFRGTDGTGVSAHALPVTPGKNTLVWSTPLPGPGSSSPVIWKDKLFVTSENRDAQSLILSCLDAHTGKELWNKQFPVGDYHLPNTVAWALAGEDRATDERMLELLEPYRPQRRRLVVSIVQSGAHAPRYGPRTPVRRHL